MWRLLQDADGVAEGESFVLRQQQQLLPLQHQSPGKLSTINIWVDGRVLKEHLEFGGVVVGSLEESFEHPNVGALFLEKLDDRFSFPLVGGGGVWR